MPSPPHITIPQAPLTEPDPAHEKAFKSPLMDRSDDGVMLHTSSFFRMPPDIPAVSIIRAGGLANAGCTPG